MVFRNIFCKRFI